MTDDAEHEARVIFDLADQMSLDKQRDVFRLTDEVGAFPREVFPHPKLKLLALELVVALEEWDKLLADLNAAGDRVRDDEDDID